MKPRVFHFDATGDAPGKFTYKPPTDWAYSHKDHLRFETNTGPFTVQFVRKDLQAAYSEESYLMDGKQLVADKAKNGVWSVETPVDDKLTDIQREALRTGNASQTEPHGFIAKYFYHIEVTDANGQTLRDRQKNGVYEC